MRSLDVETNAVFSIVYSQLSWSVIKTLNGCAPPCVALKVLIGVSVIELLILKCGL
ncbi:MAG: hypothetical protein SNJ77_10650 [Cytophagales bacterium]